MRLSASSLDQLSDDIARPSYAFATRGTGIVHIGLGAFHRAHQAVYTDDAMAVQSGDWSGDWRITGVSLRSADVSGQLSPQDCLYSVTCQSADAPQTRIIGAIANILVAPQNPQAVVDAIAHADTKIVTLTVTEKGYYQMACGALDCDNEILAAELAGHDPVSIYGFLGRALAQRRKDGAGGLTLLSCDNLSENGKKLRALLYSYLSKIDGELADWCDKYCTFPCSMVDRIVPATTSDDIGALADRMGVRDEGAVFTEAFCQWIIEDNFAAGRPPWDAVGAQIVDDVRPYELAKLRMLNGAHSALAYVGLLRGHVFVHEAMADKEIRQLVQTLMRDEAAASLRAAVGQDLDQYADALMARFDNPALNHRLAQIAMDGSQKITQRWLQPLAEHQSAGRTCPALLRALAAWIVHIRGDNDKAEDPMADKLAQIWQEQGAQNIAQALFGEAGLFSKIFIADEDNLRRLSAYIAADLDHR